MTNVLLIAALAISSHPDASSAWTVRGTQVVDGSGHVVKIRGINVPSLEWSQGDHVLESISQALDEWHANFIRLPLSQDRWFGRAPESHDSGASYRKTVDRVVSEVSRRGKHVLLDLHWSNGGVWGANIGQHTLPDDHSLEFWRSCSHRYANKPAVLFDLYNEPIEAPWSVWRDGGTVKEKFQGRDLSYHAVGLQTLLDAIRAEGAKNLVVAGGLGYASRLDGLPRYALKDRSGHGVLYADHFYPGWESTPDWEKRIAPYIQRYPVIVSEFGAGPQSLPLDDPEHRLAETLHVIVRHHWNWVAWCMHPAAAPCLIADWSYAPTPYFGRYIKAALKGEVLPIPPFPESMPDKVVYDDKLENQFQFWGWGGLDLDNSEVVHSGANSMKLTLKGFEGINLGDVPFSGTLYQSVSLWINGGPKGGQVLTLNARIGDKDQRKVPLAPLPAGQWMQVTVSMSDLGVADSDGVKSFLIQNATDAALDPIYVDDFVMIGKKG